MKHPGLILGLLLAMPMSGSQGDQPAKRSNLSVSERITLVEEFERQQKDYNTQMDAHITTHVDDIIRVQGNQEKEIAELQKSQESIDTAARIGAWLISILMTIFFVYNSRRYKEAKERHEAIQLALKNLDVRCVSIEKAILVISDRSERQLEEERSSRVSRSERVEKRIDRNEVRLDTLDAASRKEEE